MDALTQRYLEILLKTQFMQPAQMVSYQRGLLQRLVRHARAQVPFYRDSGRLNVLFNKSDEIEWERWDEVPVLTRPEAQANNADLYAAMIPPECGNLQEGQTSGSTGRPLKFRVNDLMAAAGTALLERGLVWAGLPPPTTIAWIRYVYDGNASYPMGMVYSSVVRGVPRLIHILSATTTIDDQAKWLARIKPDVVMGYPNSLAMLGQSLPSEFDHLFQLVICNGEVTSNRARETIEKTFHCNAMDIYSGSEMGTIAVEDAKTRQMFVCEETAYVEPRDGASTQNDGLSELAITPFYNYAMPLIRYVTGDYAAFDRSPPSDGRMLRRLDYVAGRERNLFILPSGKRWWPYLMASKNAIEYLSFDQFQYVQTHRDRIELRYVSGAVDPVKDRTALLAMLRAAAPEPIEFVIRQVPEIARHASGKFEEYLCAIDQEKAG